MTDEETLAKARVAYQQLQDQELARTPLAAAPHWIAAGQAPPAETLRQAGFDGVQREDIQAKRFARRAFVRRFGLAIPCAELVAALRPLAPLVEIGSGSGYLAALLRAAGAEIVATDPMVEGGILKGFNVPAHIETERLGGADAVRRYPQRNVLCSWPSEGEPWAFEAAREIASGRRLALIADARGITGDAALFDLLDDAFEVEGLVELPQFPNVRDRLTIYRRR
jgi:hypothetical protein